eukprot:Lithocolla_globosa_v1_NODE_2060_length_2186_cov_35.565462.p1 type:complete len:276 gc:universal NODE_2060_length_2186_cov_35.565462:484-1311(+)
MMNKRRNLSADPQTQQQAVRRPPATKEKPKTTLELADPELYTVANFLLKQGMKSHSAVCAGKRVDYFRAKRAINLFLSDDYKKLSKVPEVETRVQAQALFTRLIKNEFLHLCKKIENSKNLEPLPFQVLKEDDYYLWLYEGSSFWARVKGTLLVIGVFAAVLFPMWPHQMRVGVWYLSMLGLVFVGFLLVIMVIRPIFYILSKLVAPPGIWIFPNINDESIGIIESFKPVWDWDPDLANKRRLRREAKEAAKEAAEKATSANSGNNSEQTVSEAD